MQGESDTRRCSITVKIALHRTNSSLFKQFLILRSGPHSKVYQARDPVLHRQLAPRVRLPEGNLADLGLVLVLVVGRGERRLDFSAFCLIFDVNDIVVVVCVLYLLLVCRSGNYSSQIVYYNVYMIIVSQNSSRYIHGSIVKYPVSAYMGEDKNDQRLSLPPSPR